jgi:hypothetical protein
MFVRQFIIKIQAQSPCQGNNREFHLWSTVLVRESVSQVEISVDCILSHKMFLIPEKIKNISTVDGSSPGSELYIHCS